MVIIKLDQYTVVLKCSIHLYCRTFEYFSFGNELFPQRRFQPFGILEYSENSQPIQWW